MWYPKYWAVREKKRRLVIEPMEFVRVLKEEHVENSGVN